jgi:RNA polymerase sigma factor (sigma-70 family)
VGWGERSARSGVGEDAVARAVALAARRLDREYYPLKRRLMAVARVRYRLPDEDCEEVVDDVLLEWHRELGRADGVRNDRAFVLRVLRSRAIDRIRRRRVPTLELAAAENRGRDPQLDTLIAAREELRRLHEIAPHVLDADERTVLRQRGQGERRAAIAEREGLSFRQVRRILEHAREKLEEARVLLDEYGTCAIVMLTIDDIDAGKIELGDPRRAAAIEHLARCGRCRGSRRVAAGDGR